MKTINELSEEIHQNAINKGFWPNGIDLPKALMLTVSEISEALEADRNDKYSDVIEFEKMLSIDELKGDDSHFIASYNINIKNTFNEEIADAVMRLFDIAKYKGIDLQFHIEQKMRYNKLRPHKHGKKY